MSPQMIDNLLRQDHFQQMNLLQAILRLYKVIKTQTHLPKKIGDLNSYENCIVMAPYYKYLGLKVPVAEGI